MAISPILRGMLGLEIDAAKHQMNLTPHIPADWTSVGIHNVHVGGVSVDLRYRKTTDSIELEANRTGNGDCWIEFSPAFSLRTQIVKVEMNGRPLPFKVQPNSNDQHLLVHFPVSGGPNNLVILVKNDFGLSLNSELPPLGSASRGLRVTSQSWNASRTQLTLHLSGRSGSSYEMAVWNPAQISSVEGAVLKNGKLEIQIPSGPSDSYVPQDVEIRFGR
jgi:hypothetical protein